MVVWHNISYFYTLYVWCVITLVTCRQLYGATPISQSYDTLEHEMWTITVMA